MISIEISRAESKYMNIHTPRSNAGPVLHRTEGSVKHFWNIFRSHVTSAVH